MPPPLSPEQIEILNDVYYKGHNYFGRDRLYPLVASHGISRRQVAHWLSRQATNQIFYPARLRKTFKTLVPSAPFHTIQMDLIDLGQFADPPLKFLLTAIDTFSKYAFAEPLSSKAEVPVSKAIIKVLDDIDKVRKDNSLSAETYPVKVIKSDNGKEFKNKRLTPLLSERGITQVYGTPHTPQGQGLVERFNKTLKELIKKNLLLTDNKSWKAILPTLVQNYNNTFQDTIRYSPSDSFKHIDQIRTRLEDRPTKGTKKLPSLPPIEKGDTVRIQLPREKSKKGGENWSVDTYVVSAIRKGRDGIDTYSVDPSSSDAPVLDRRFFREELLKVEEVQNQPVRTERWEISKLMKPSVQDGEPGYLCLFKGYRDLYFSKRDDLIEDVPKLVETFEKKNDVRWYKNAKDEWAFSSKTK